MAERRGLSRRVSWGPAQFSRRGSRSRVRHRSVRRCADGGDDRRDRAGQEPDPPQRQDPYLRRPQPPVRRGRHPQRTDRGDRAEPRRQKHWAVARRPEGDRPARPHRHPRHDRGARPLRQPREPARLPRRDRERAEHRRRSRRCSRRGGRGVPAGQFITAMGGWHPNMFAERRLPTLAELDAAVPDRPVFLYQGQRPGGDEQPGQGVLRVGHRAARRARHRRRRRLDRDRGPNATPRLYHLRVRQTSEDKVRGAADAMAYAASVGITACSTRCCPVARAAHPDARGCPTSTTTGCTTRWLASHREGKYARSGCRRTSCTTRTTSTCPSCRSG